MISSVDLRPDLPADSHPSRYPFNTFPGEFSFAPQPLFIYLTEITFHKTARGSHTTSRLFFPWSQTSFYGKLNLPFPRLLTAPLSSCAQCGYFRSYYMGD